MSDRDAPRVSVVMAAFDSARHLPETIESLLGQTWRDFELVVADDASGDATPDILAAAAARDSRIRVLRLEANVGWPGAVNRALDIARGEIVVRSDADDVSRRDRIARQVAFLDSHPDHGFIASSYRAIDDAGRHRYTKVKPMDHIALRWLARFRMPVQHPSLCFRARLDDGTAPRYPQGRMAQDYPFVAWLSERTRGAVLAEPLLDYRTHARNITSTRGGEQMQIGFETARAVQARDVSGLAPRLEGLMRCYLFQERATPERVRTACAAVSEMLARDAALHPQAAGWMRRQAAGILAEALLRRGGGARDPATLAAFLRHGALFLGPLALRALEDAGRLPRCLDVSPEPGA